MKSEIKYFANSLKNYSKGLKKKSILVNKPWVLIESDLNFERLLFKKNKDLIISNDGEVTVGKWDYHPEINSLQIDRNEEKILLQELYVDEAVMILIKGSSEENLHFFVNEKIIPDLNIKDYLKKLLGNNAVIQIKVLNSGEKLEIELDKEKNYPVVGNRVFFDLGDVPDGYYKSKDQEYIIKENKISEVYFIEFYLIKGGLEIKIEQQKPNTISIGDRVWKDDLQVNDGKYQLRSASEIDVKDSKVICVRTSYGLF